MSECLHLTDEEALGNLLSCITHNGEDEVPTLVVAVVGSHFQTQYMQLSEGIPTFDGW